MVSKRKQRSTIRGIQSPMAHFVCAGLVLSVLFAGSKYYDSLGVDPILQAPDGAAHSAESAYRNEVKLAAARYNLNYSYLMSLLMLECSGKKPAGSRFEPHVFKRLKQVRDGQRASYENVTSRHLANASDAALRNLATSWGPFQLMGYKCILLDVKIEDIRGPNGVEHGAKWINLTYGDVMRQGRYRDCFHIHNTGRPYPKSGGPKTHDPKYVPRGLAMMKQF